MSIFTKAKQWHLIVLIVGAILLYGFAPNTVTWAFMLVAVLAGIGVSGWQLFNIMTRKPSAGAGIGPPDNITEDSSSSKEDIITPTNVPLSNEEDDWVEIKNPPENPEVKSLPEDLPHRKILERNGISRLSLFAMVEKDNEQDDPFYANINQIGEVRGENIREFVETHKERFFALP